MSCRTYRQYFPNVTGNTLAVTENGGAFPSNLYKIRVFMNGNKLWEPQDYSISGSNVVLSFLGNGSDFEVLFSYP